MCKPSWSSHSAFYACVAIVTLLGVNFLFLKTLVQAFAQQSVADFWTAVGSSAWARATVVDFVSGVLVLSIWIGSRTGELVCGFPHGAWAVLVPFLGNPVAALYLAAAFFQARDVGVVLVPHDTVPDDTFPGFRTARRAIASVCSILLVVYAMFLARAVWAEDVVAGYHALKEAPLLYATFLDNLLGVGCVALVLAYREGRQNPLNPKSIGWVAALALFGHGASLLYTLLVAAEAETLDASFGSVIASPAVSQRRRSTYV